LIQARFVFTVFFVFFLPLDGEIKFIVIRNDYEDVTSVSIDVTRES